MGWCTLKLDEEKSKDASFVQRNGFDLTFWQKSLKKCNKHDLTITPYFWLANSSDWFELITELKPFLYNIIEFPMTKAIQNSIYVAPEV